jgi:hypothetical protein
LSFSPSLLLLLLLNLSNFGLHVTEQVQKPLRLIEAATLNWQKASLSERNIINCVVDPITYDLSWASIDDHVASLT